MQLHYQHFGFDESECHPDDTHREPLWQVEYQRVEEYNNVSGPYLTTAVA